MTRTIEQQLASLGDVVEAELDVTVDARVTSLDKDKSGGWSLVRPLLAAAAALALVALGVSVVARNQDIGPTVFSSQPGNVNLVVTDPLNIDLSEIAAQSQQRRISEIGEQLTFDWDALPNEWEVTIIEAGLVPSREGAEYFQTVEIRLRGQLSFDVTIWGTLDGGSPPFSNSGSGTEVDVRGQAGRLNPGRIEWIEAESLWVTIAGPPLAELESDYLLVANSLNPVEAEIPWSGPDAQGRLSPAQSGDDPLVAGQLLDSRWLVTDRPVEFGPLQLFVDGLHIGGSTSVSPLEPNDALISSDPVSGGTIVLLDMPASVSNVLLRTESGDAQIPVVRFGEERTATAVPIEDAIDPIALDFLDDSGNVLGTFSLDDLVPFSGGSSGTSIVLDES